MGNTFSAKTPSYASVASSNPYATARVNGSSTSFTLNDFLSNQNNTIEQAVPSLYQRLANPTLDDPITQARKRAFTNALNEQSGYAFENNIINPLSERRMLRSSLVNDLSNNLQKQQTSQIASFNNEQIANALSDTQSLIDFYMKQYKNNASYGFDTLNAALSHSNSVNSYNKAASQNNIYNNARTAAQLISTLAMII